MFMCSYGVDHEVKGCICYLYYLKFCCRYKKLGPRLKRSVLECQETYSPLLEPGLLLQRNRPAEELCLTLMCELSILSVLPFFPIDINVSRDIH